MQQIDSWTLGEKEKAIEYLMANDFLFNELKGFYWKKLQFDQKDIYLRIVLFEQFPLMYPKFYVDQKDWYLKYPHIEKDKEYGFNICYVDSENKVALFDGEELISRELNKIYQIIKSYENNSFNTKDFLEEFDSYWGESSIYLDVRTDIREPKIINLLQVEKFKQLTTADIEKTKLLLQNMNLEISREEEIIFLPFFDKFTYPFPKTKSEILKIVEDLGYKTFLEEHIDRSNLKVVFSFKIDEHTHYGALKFSKPYKQVLVDSEIVPIRVKRIDRDRIFSRGGDDKTLNISKTPIEVTIIGCGSLGASLALKLAKSGIKNFVLIDPDILTINNIGRHICGMKYINQFKVDALKIFLLEQFPDLEIEAISKNGIECLDSISQTGIIISAVGSEGEGFEQLVLQMKHSKNKFFTMPIVLTWFESGIAGQVVLVKETDIDDFPVFIDKVTVLEGSTKDKLTKLDMGCNSSFSPYAFIDAENTVLHASLLITNFISSIGKMDEEVWTIFNDTIQYKEYLKDEYKDIDAYSIQKQKLKDVI